ncbi:MAG: NADPH-dependent glutamate synthase [Desulfovibrionaceae bacterium]
MSEKKAKKPVAPRTPMPEQDPKVRARNFQEVALGYSREQALLEAARCLQCKKPTCRDGCPVEIDIKGFIAELVKGDVPGAYRVIRATNSLPAVCGRVCPQESQCEGSCILGKKHQPVAIGRLERFVADTYAAESACDQLTGTAACAAPLDKRVACIGGGPSSLTCAGILAAAGVKVTLFEALHEPGGVLVYGIPEFRLPKDVVRREVEALRALGVDLRCNWVGGATITIGDLLAEGYDGIFIGVGAGLPRFMGVPGENYVGVFSANEYLTRINLGRAYDFPNHDTPAPYAKQAVVIGGGNVAMDAARTALRMGAEKVTILYRRTLDEMPARAEEVHHAQEEGVEIKCLCGPMAFNGDEHMHLKSVTLQMMCLGEPDATGRRAPVCIEGDTQEIEADLAIIAVGTRPNPTLLATTPDLKLSKRGYVVADPETGETNMPGVYAGGDIVTGAATVISAMGAGRKAALAMLEKFRG